MQNHRLKIHYARIILTIGMISLVINCVVSASAQTAYELREKQGEPPYHWDSQQSSKQQEPPTTNSQGPAQGGIDTMITQLKNDGDALKAEIANINLFKTDLVEDLINKVYYYEGRVSAWGGGTWVYLHDVQETLLSKIKSTGQDGFTVPEQAAIESFATNAAQSKIDHPTVNVFG